MIVKLIRKIPPIIYDDSASYRDFRRTMDKYSINDNRELNFQNRAILCMLEKIFINSNLEVVDTSTLYYRGPKNSKTLDNFRFTAKGFAPPDLLIVRNWNLDNVNNEVEYIAAIEIKSPKSKKEWICGRNFQDYYYHLKDEMNAHLSVNNKVILTDCYRWQFFEQKDGFIDTPSIDLVDENKKWKEKSIELDDAIVDLLGLNDKTVMDDPDEWSLLGEKLISFLNIEQ